MQIWLAAMVCLNPSPFSLASQLRSVVYTQCMARPNQMFGLRGIGGSIQGDFVVHFMARHTAHQNPTPSPTFD
ncbi:hypothetical protein V565_194090 [Rhizoctonia solani 123E]|uniref:Secreted protein n=1 Tax=Rhizoctonia solani 123E TaxID=1423351 RepID=A0A074S918_9AGAM|nr:hypothetical protein V565_194090 [Rhizoctonia solani 123E]